MLLTALLLAAVSARIAAAVGDDRETWAQRRAALAADDLEGRLALAEWGLAHGLRAEARGLFLEVLEREPDSARAHRGLGHVFLDGRWSTAEAARTAERAMLEAVLEKAGLLRFGEGWDTAEGVRQRRAGNVFVDGAWRSPDLARAARGEVKLGGEWVGGARALAAATGTRLKMLTAEAFGVTLGKHVMVASTGEEAGRTALVDAMDGAVEDVLALQRSAGSGSPWELPVRVVLLAKPAQLEPVDQWLPFHAERVGVWFRPAPDGTGLRLVRDNEGRAVLVVFVGEGDAGSTTAARCFMVYGITRLAVAARARSERPPFWIAEGLAALTQVTRAPGGHVACTGDRPPQLGPAGPFTGLEDLKAFLGREGLVPLSELLAVTPDSAARKHVAQAVAFLTFLIGHHPTAVAACLHPPVTEGDQVRRLEAVAGKPLAEVDAVFRKWMEQEKKK